MTNNNISGLDTARNEFTKLPEIPIGLAEFDKSFLQNIDRSQEIIFQAHGLNNTTFKNLLFYFAEISGAPKEYILTSLLACLSGAIGKYAYFEISPSLTIYLNVWAVIIGKSTIMRKSTSINYVKDSLQRIQHNSNMAHQKEITDYYSKINCLKNEKEKADYIKPVKNYFLLPNDCTVESLSDILQYSKRGLLIQQEFGGFLQQLNRSYSGDAKQFFTGIFDVPQTWEVARKTVDNTFLERPFVSILGASTIDWIKEFTGSADIRSGFLARFLFSIRNIPDSDYVPLLELNKRSKETQIKINPREIFDYLTGLKDNISLQITKDASDLFNLYDYNNYYNLFKTANEDENAFKGRLLTYCLKFAGIIALSDKRSIVTVKDIEDAILITEYYKRNVERLLNTEIVGNENTAKEEKVYRLIEKAPGGEIGRSDLSNRANLKNKKELDEILINLTDKEKIVSFSKKADQSKRASIYYKINLK